MTATIHPFVGAMNPRPAIGMGELPPSCSPMPPLSRAADMAMRYVRRLLTADRLLLGWTLSPRDAEVTHEFAAEMSDSVMAVAIGFGVDFDELLEVCVRRIEAQQ
jgi:hypothetical protein